MIKTIGTDTVGGFINYFLRNQFHHLCHRIGIHPVIPAQRKPSAPSAYSQSSFILECWCRLAFREQSRAICDFGCTAKSRLKVFIHMFLSP